MLYCFSTDILLEISADRMQASDKTNRNNNIDDKSLESDDLQTLIDEVIVEAGGTVQALLTDEGVLLSIDVVNEAPIASDSEIADSYCCLRFSNMGIFSFYEGN